MLQKLYSWYGKKMVWSVTALVAILIVGGVIFNAQKSTEVETVSDLPLVKVMSVSELSGKGEITIVGSVRAVSEAEIETEAAGRITSVQVSLGDTVAAGQILATQENASQRAAVLQAEGSYEAALAAASQSDISVASSENALAVAKNNVISSYNTLFTTANDVLLTSIDDFFSNPNKQTPGLYISGNGFTQTLNSERVAFKSIMQTWQQNSANISTNSDLQSLATQAEADTVRLISMVDIFLNIINNQDRGTEVSGTPVESYNAIFIADRSALNASLSALLNNIRNLETAEENLQKAKISGSNTGLSAANAQVKQALGALRATQANLEKTILRSPIAGTVNSLNVNIGDFVGAFSPVAKIANNNALEISAFVGENDLAQIAIGSEVLINNKFIGTVTHIAAGIDSSTKKTEIKIATETTELTSGNTVTVAIATNQAVTPVETNIILLPITAIKFKADNGQVYTVEDKTLVAHEVVIGAVRGSNVEVVSGVSPDMQIVVDARGLSSGAKVEATN